MLNQCLIFTLTAKLNLIKSNAKVISSLQLQPVSPRSLQCFHFNPHCTTKALLRALPALRDVQRVCHPVWMDKSGGVVLPVKQTAVSHGYIVSIAPCLDGSPLLPPAAPHISAGAAESKLDLSELPKLTAPDDNEEELL